MSEESQRRVIIGRRSTSDLAAEDEDPPIWTFRVAIMGCISSLFLFFLNKYFLREVGESIMMMVIVSVVLYPLGWIIALFSPKRRVYYPWAGLEFSVNAGPFGFGEFALISLFANLGAVLGVLTSNSLEFTYTAWDES